MFKSFVKYPSRQTDMNNYLLIRVVCYLVTVIVIVKSESTYPPIYYYEVMGMVGDPLEITTDKYGNIFIKELLDDTKEEYVEFDKEKFLDFVDTDMSDYSPKTKGRIRDRINMEKQFQPKVKQIHLPVNYEENEQETIEDQEETEYQESSEDPAENKEEKENAKVMEMDSDDEKEKAKNNSVIVKNGDSSTPWHIENIRNGDGISETLLIDDGKNVNGEQYPYHALIYTEDKIGHICSGAVINIRFVITAATCVYNEKKENLRITIGRRENIKNYEVSKIIFCDKFKILENNIALLKTKQQMEELDHPDFRAINIPVDTKVTITGFKCSSLRYGVAQIVSNETCKNTFSFAKEESICGEVPNNNHGKKCFEELGSPVVWNDVIVGVVSHSKTGQASRYMSIDYYYDWIFREIVRNSVAQIG